MPHDRLNTAQWILERQLAWIVAADSKVAALITITTAMLGGLAAAFSSVTDMKSVWTLSFCLFAVVCGGASIACSALALLPRTNGPKESLVFFGPISAISADDYATRLKDATDEELLKDWSFQIHRNAQIARGKHAWVRRGMKWAFAGAPAWAIAIYLLVKV
jgi:hypothetical protein